MKKKVDLNVKYSKAMTLFILSRIFGVVTALSSFAFITSNQTLYILGIVLICCFSMPTFILYFIGVIMLKSSSPHFNRAFYYIIAQFCLAPFLLAFFIMTMTSSQDPSYWSVIALNITYIGSLLLEALCDLAQINGSRYLVTGDDHSSFGKTLYIATLTFEALSLLFFILCMCISSAFTAMLALNIAFGIVASVTMLILFTNAKNKLSGK